LQKNGYLVQPFSRAIHDGEYSLIFIGGQYSHAALKKPKSGDFRVQHDWGGSFGAASAKGDLVEAASAVLQVLPSAPAYARIDGVLEQGEFLLMEAELIEPDLFFRLCPASAARLADLLIALA
jgi:hypothetical protein